MNAIRYTPNNERNKPMVLDNPNQDDFNEDDADLDTPTTRNPHHGRALAVANTPVDHPDNCRCSGCKPVR